MRRCFRLLNFLTPLKMESKELALIIILIISGELHAEEKPCDLPTMENGRIALFYYTFKSYYFPMGIAKKLPFFCLAGYTTEAGKQEGQSTCTAEGWSPEPKCFKKCTRPDVENGYVSDIKLLYKIQENMLYNCASGYKTMGGKEEEVVQCLSSGWSSQPSCRKEHETCLAPELSHGNYSTTQKTFNVNDKVQYECAPGFYTTGGRKTEEAECHTYGWSLTPACTKLKCSSLRLIENGYFHPVKQTYEEGDVVQFFCHENYYLSGSDLIQCYNFGWYPASPVCEVEFNGAFCISEPCTVNVDDMNRHNIEMKWKYEGKVLHGDLIDFACKEGYDLPPSSTLSELSVHCDRGDVNYPVCIKKEFREMCTSPPLIKNGVIISSAADTYENGSSVTYQCFQHYFLQGSRNAYCLEGQWTPAPLCLEPCTLSFVAMENNNLRLKWDFDNRPYILHGEYIEFLCRRDTYLAESSITGSELRVRCERGQLKYPWCAPRERRKKRIPQASVLSTTHKDIK
ncbi:coagulation factor XIII B chain [Echinops telfairi]|uniref:Coagulation factor XIII B chain n=1 Tax=Echinops telfairi TaxID=9371 RepID=A0AC55DQU5_ECHTE|nr:coagulation factor XIII B chain [Echinops telfairi]